MINNDAYRVLHMSFTLDVYGDTLVIGLLSMTMWDFA